MTPQNVQNVACETTSLRGSRLGGIKTGKTGLERASEIEPKISGIELFRLSSAALFAYSGVVLLI